MIKPEEVFDELSPRVWVDTVDERATAAERDFRAYVEDLAERFDPKTFGREDDEQGTDVRRAGEVPMRFPDVVVSVESYGELRQVKFMALIEVEIDGEIRPAVETTSFSSGTTGLRIGVGATTEVDGVTRDVTLVEYTCGGLFSPLSTEGEDKVEAFEHLAKHRPV